MPSAFFLFYIKLFANSVSYVKFDLKTIIRNLVKSMQFQLEYNYFDLHLGTSINDFTFTVLGGERGSRFL